MKRKARSQEVAAGRQTGTEETIDPTFAVTLPVANESRNSTSLRAEGTGETRSGQDWMAATREVGNVRCVR